MHMMSTLGRPNMTFFLILVSADLSLFFTALRYFHCDFFKKLYLGFFFSGESNSSLQFRPVIFFSDYIYFSNMLLI